MAIKIRLSMQAARLLFAAILAVVALCPQGRAATLLPPGESCFQATAGVNGMVGLLGTITGGTGGTAGTYANVPLTGGSGSGATANITVSGGAVTAVTTLNPGTAYVVADVLSAASGNIGNVSGFSVSVSSTSINSSLAGGTVAFYIPNTSTFKQTWFNSDQALIHQNTNPVTLDANGCAIIYGSGFYRQVLKDSLGNTVWDQLTADTSSSNSTFWAGISAGTPNAIAVTDAGFNSTDGSIIYFQALNSNTGAATLSPSGIGPYQIVRDTSTGPVTLSGGEIAAGGVVGVLFTASTNQFHLIDYIQSTGSAAATIAPPQGYLNLVGAANGSIIQTVDVTAATGMYYSPFVGNQVPIWNGSAFIERTFPEISMNFTASAHQANTIYDACVFSNAGNLVLVTGPAWSNSGAGAGARGTGAGTAQLQKLNGIWVNAVQITGTNGATTYTIAANTCTYLGSIFVDGTAGQVSAYRTWGQSRKWGVWNNYNRQAIYLKAGDSTATWTYSTATIRPSNGSTANSLIVFSGLPEETYNFGFNQNLDVVNNGATASNFQIGIGYNSTTAFSGQIGEIKVAAAANITLGPSTIQAQYIAPPAIGINTITSLENCPAAGTGNLQSGTEANMVLSAWWRG